MALKENLKKKIPKKYQETPEFNILLKIIKQKKLDTAGKLREYINREITVDQEWLNERKRMNTDGTMNRWMVKRAKRIDFFKTLRNKILKLI